MWLSDGVKQPIEQWQEDVVVGRWPIVMCEVSLPGGVEKPGKPFVHVDAPMHRFDDDEIPHEAQQRARSKTDAGNNVSNH